MTITSTIPASGTIIATGATLTITNTIGESVDSITLNRSGTGGANEVIYTSGSGYDTPYTGSRTVDGADETFTFRRNAGWDASPFQIDVETTSATEQLSFTLVGQGEYPPDMQPFNDPIGGSGSGAGVGSDAVIADNVLVRGDGGQRNVQGSGVTLTDADALSGISAINISGSLSAASVLASGQVIASSGLETQNGITLLEKTSAGFSIPGYGEIWTKDVSGNTRLFFTDDAGVDHDITDVGGGTDITVVDPTATVLTTAVKKFYFVGAGVDITEPSPDEIAVTIDGAAVPAANLSPIIETGTGTPDNDATVPDANPIILREASSAVPLTVVGNAGSSDNAIEVQTGTNLAKGIDVSDSTGYGTYIRPNQVRFKNAKDGGSNYFIGADIGAAVDGCNLRIQAGGGLTTNGIVSIEPGSDAGAAGSVTIGSVSGSSVSLGNATGTTTLLGTVIGAGTVDTVAGGFGLTTSGTATDVVVEQDLDGFSLKKSAAGVRTRTGPTGLGIWYYESGTSITGININSIRFNNADPALATQIFMSNSPGWASAFVGSAILDLVGHGLFITSAEDWLTGLSVVVDAVAPSAEASGTAYTLDITVDPTQAWNASTPGDALQVNPIPRSGSTGVNTFIALTDVDEPDYAGHAGEFVKVNAGADGLDFGTPVGAGDVVGPASAVDDNIATFNLNTGKLIQDSGVAIGTIATAEANAQTGIADAATAQATADAALVSTDINTLAKLNAIVSETLVDDTHTHEGTTILSTAEGGGKVLTSSAGGAATWERRGRTGRSRSWRRVSHLRRRGRWAHRRSRRHRRRSLGRSKRKL